MKVALVNLAVLLAACGSVAAPTPATCPADQTLCGTCVDLSTSVQNCGACGHACAAGEVCGDGTCAARCPADQIECGDTCADPATDAMNCGGCGQACGSGEVCVDRACQVPCDTSKLSSSIQDPWGMTWDGLERPVAALDVAKAACDAFGARLPTASELYRVSATQSAAVGQSFNTNYLWSLDPDDHLNQAVLRLSDGGTSTLAAASPGAYRCVCPPASMPSAFAGGHCNGAPGTECFTFGSYNFDSKDRPALRKSAAVWECTNEHAHLADLPQLVEAARNGLPGSGRFLMTADAADYHDSSAIRWSTTSWTPPGDAGIIDFVTPAPFRCAGPAAAVSANPNAIDNPYVGPLSRYKSETVDTAAASWVAAQATCVARGGHLPRETEMAELIQQGLPNGTNTGLWSADEVGYNGTQFLAAINIWTALDQRYSFAYTGDAATTASWAYKTDASHAFRCIYYPLDPSVAPPTTCKGGCFSLVLPGTPAPTMWFDSLDREPAIMSDAFATCAAEQGHVASERDYTEAILGGLPNGVGNGNYLFTSDFGLGTNPTLATMIVQWTAATAAGFADEYPSDMTWADPAPGRAYRCMWTNELR